MKNTVWVLAIAAISVSVSSCSHQMSPEGRFQDRPVIVDGNTDDWAFPLRFSNEAYTLQYNVTNDNENIYICVVTKDNATQMNILKEGMSVYFDPKGKDSKSISLVFPVKKTNSENIPVNGANKKALKHQYVLESDFYNTIGFNGMDNGQYAVKDTKTSIRTALKLDKDSGLVYEASVPIKNITGKTFTAKQAKNFSVDIVVNSIVKQAKVARPSYTAKGPGPQGMSLGGGNKGMRGGGRGGMRSMNTSQGNNQSTEKNTVSKETDNWYQFKLAYKNS